MRIQTNTENKGITDYIPDKPESSVSRPGYLHYSGTEFTEEWVGGFGDFIAKLVGDGLVVEVGCGSAIVSRYCKEYIGLDGNVEAGNCCVGEFFPVDVYLPFAFDPPVEADWLISFNFMEHIEEHALPIMFASLDKMLKKGGKIFFIIDHSGGQTEHVLQMEDDNWWHDRLQAAGWVRDDVPKAFKDEYFDNMPIHWKNWGLQGWQRLFLYHKEG
jgi:hypothetical protein